MNFLNRDYGFYYKVPSMLSDEQIDILVRDLDSDFFPGKKEQARLGDGMKGEDLNRIRKTTIKWVYNDCWVAGILAHTIECANRHFKFDLAGFYEGIQYTVYSELGDHYQWHIDQKAPSLYGIRKLSVTLLLSDPSDYEGGQFQIHNGCTMDTPVLKKGDAIVFPSTLPHRVRPIKSGVRRSLVAWSCGPVWR